MRNLIKMFRFIIGFYIHEVVLKKKNNNFILLFYYKNKLKKIIM